MPPLGAYAFPNINHSIPVYVPCGASEAYQNADGWRFFPNIIGDGTNEYTVRWCQYYPYMWNSFYWHGTWYAESGTYTFETTDQECWREEVLHLFVDIEKYSDTIVEACNAFEWNGVTWTSSGDYEYTFTSQQGCDSIVTLRLTISDAILTEISEQACESFNWNGIIYNISGNYTQYFTSVQGCDSIVTLHLTISDAIQTDFSDQACDSYIWNGTTYTTSGNYTQYFTSAQGCDSIVTLHLTISEAIQTEISEQACDEYTWNGGTYYDTGDYTQQFTSLQGCDSIVTLHLTINPSEAEEYTITAADSYTWHGETYTESGTYTFDTLTAQGCPRTETLHLTISGVQSYTITATAGPNGSISPEGEIHVVPGGLQTFTLTPDDGCALSRVIIDGVEYAPTETVAFTNVRGNHTIHALFWGMGVGENEMPAVRISPNPAKREALVECEGMRRITLYNLSGVMVYDMVTRNDAERITLDRLSPGVYVVKVVLEGNYCQYAKLIVSE